MRTIDLSKLEKTGPEKTDPVTFMLSADVQMKLILIRVPKEYDLVSTPQQLRGEGGSGGAPGTC